LLLVVLALAAAWIPANARADGDPASDVLASQLLFLPGDGGIPYRRQAELSAVLEAANRAGYPLRVAVVAAPADLGSVGALWRRPSSYARFLGLELSLVYRGTVLVVMPNGFGLDKTRGLTAAEEAALAGRSAPPGSGARLGASTEDAVRRLAATAGHTLLVSGKQPVPTRQSGVSAAWIVYPAGALTIVLAWGASLRAKPPRRHSGTPNPE
jgi:hypothetical protein